MPLGWVLVPHEGNSELQLQQELLSWLKEILPEKAQAVIVADREFDSIRLAEWLEKELKLDYGLRIKAGTHIEFDGEMLKTSEITVKGESFGLKNVKITRTVELAYRTNLTVHWAEDEAAAWVLATNLELEESIEVYAKRFWIEEMFSDHKSRGLNLEKTRLTDADRIQKLLVAARVSVFMVNGNRLFGGQHRQPETSG